VGSLKSRVFDSLVELYKSLIYETGLQDVMKRIHTDNASQCISESCEQLADSENERVWKKN